MLCLLVIYMFISAVAGMQLLGNPNDGGIPLESRARFTDFWIAMLTIFQVGERGQHGGGGGGGGGGHHDGAPRHMRLLCPPLISSN